MKITPTALLVALTLGCGDVSTVPEADGQNPGNDSQPPVPHDGAPPTGADAAADAAAPPVACNADSPDGFSACVDKDRYVADLEAVAVPRPADSPGWQQAQDHCANSLREAGYEVELDDYGSGINVIGRKRGTTSPDTEVILSAHYDSVEDCTGADDNATGIAGVLEAARVLASGTFDRTLVVACWDEEEIGYHGSNAYADEAFEQSRDIAIAIVFDMIGYRDETPESQELPFGFGLIFPEVEAEVTANENRGDFLAVLSGPESGDVGVTMEEHGEPLGLPVIHLELTAEQTRSPLLGDLRRSDHDSFWQYSYPAIFITDTSEFRNPGYHCRSREDSVDTLDHDFAWLTIRATVTATAARLGM